MATKLLGLLLATAWLASHPLEGFAQVLGHIGRLMESAKEPDAPRLRCCGSGCITVTRFEVEIDPSTPLEKLLPRPPWQAPPPLPWLVKDLTQAPEILVQEPL